MERNSRRYGTICEQVPYFAGVFAVEISSVATAMHVSKIGQDRLGMPGAGYLHQSDCVMLGQGSDQKLRMATQTYRHTDTYQG